MVKECEWCFNTFTPYRPQNIYCTPRCGKLADKARYRSALRERAEMGDQAAVELLAKHREKKNAARRTKWATDPEYRAQYYKKWRSWYRRNRVTEGLTIYG